MIFHHFHCVSPFCRSGRSWKKGRGKRSKAKIGPKKKTHVKEGDVHVPALLYPSQWLNVSIPDGWNTIPHERELRLCQISSQALSSIPPLVVTRSIVVKADYSWMLHVNNHQVDPQNISSFVEVPPFLDASSTTSLLQAVCTLNTCVGNPDPKFIDLAKSKKNSQFLSSEKEVVAYLDSGFSVVVDGQQYASTVRCSSCHLLTDRLRCTNCGVYRSTLIAMSYRFEKRNTTVQSKTTNYRYV